MRRVTGFYHMTSWRFKSKIHSIVVIAPEMDDATAAVRKFLSQAGYSYSIGIDQFKKIRSIPASATVIVADFYSE